MPSRSDDGVPRCLLCSMDCPIGAQDDGLGHVSTVFPAELGFDQGACVRGLTAAWVLQAPDRLLVGRMGEEEGAADAVLRDVVRAASRYGGSQTAVLVDVSRPIEGVLATAALCREGGVRLAVWAPPADLPLVKAGLTACPPFGEIADCDLVLAVGDPFSTHPVVAASVRDMQFGARGRRLVSVDTAVGRTGRAADERVAVGPMKLAGFVAALAVECGAQAVASALGGRSGREICAALDIPFERVAGLAARLKGTDKVGVILSNSLGRYSAPTAVAAAVKELSAALGARLWPLLIATNSALLPRLRRRFGATDTEDLIRAAEGGELKVLCVIGCDPSSVLPQRLWRPLVEKPELVFWAGSLRCAFGDAADAVVPLTLPWQEEGTVLSSSGEPARFVAWLPKEPTVLTVSELMMRAAVHGGAGPVRACSVDELMSAEAPAAATDELIDESILSAAEPLEGQAAVVGSPEPQGYLGGLSLAGASWQRRLAGEERAIVSGLLARELGVAAGGLVTLGNGSGATLPCKGLPEQEGAVVAVPEHWPTLRELIRWQDGERRMEPAPAVVGIKRA